MLILFGQSHPRLAAALAKSLSAPLADRSISRFPDQTFKIRLNSSAKGRSASGGDVKGETIVLVQTLIHPVHDHLIELLLLADAAKSAGAKKIIAIIPYLAYSKQDLIFLPGEPLSVRVIAQILSATSIDEIITLDLHHPHIADFFSVPIRNLSFLPTIASHCEAAFGGRGNLVVFAPDKGAIVRAQLIAAQLHLPLITIGKHRSLLTGKVSIKRTLLAEQGESLKEKDCLLVDDLIVTGATLVAAAKFLKANDAKSISVFAAHSLFTNGFKKLRSAGINSITVSDSIPHKNLPSWINTISIIPLLTDTVNNVING